MNDLTLYQLPDTYKKIVDLDLPDEVVEEILESFDFTLKETSRNITKTIRNLKGAAELIKEEEKRLKEKRYAIETREAKIKEELLNVMLKTNTQNIKTETDTIYIGTSKSTNITNMNDIPDDLKEAMVTWKADKKAIKKAIESGEEVKGAEIKESKWLGIR